jgi:hypothetical protein
VSSPLLELVLLIGVGLSLAAYVRRVISADPQQRRSLVMGGLVAAGGLCLLGTGVLLVIALTAVNDEVGNTWANTGAHELVVPMIICAVAGLACFVAAWRVRPRSRD